MVPFLEKRSWFTETHPYGNWVGTSLRCLNSDYKKYVHNPLYKADSYKTEEFEIGDVIAYCGDNKVWYVFDKEYCILIGYDTIPWSTKIKFIEHHRNNYSVEEICNRLYKFIKGEIKESVSYQ